MKRAVAAYKYIRTEGSKSVVLTFCRYKKDLAVHVQMEHQATLGHKKPTYDSFRKAKKI